MQPGRRCGQRWCRVGAWRSAFGEERPGTLASLSLPLDTFSALTGGSAPAGPVPQDFLTVNEMESTKPSLFLGEQGDGGKRKENVL